MTGGAPRDQTHARRGADGPRAELREEIALVLVRDGRNDVDEARDAAVAVLLRELGAELVQGDGLAGSVRANELGGDAGGDSEQLFGLGRAYAIQHITY
jgi:hypothetical protein